MVSYRQIKALAADAPATKRISLSPVTANQSLPGQIPDTAVAVTLDPQTRAEANKASHIASATSDELAYGGAESFLLGTGTGQLGSELAYEQWLAKHFADERKPHTLIAAVEEKKAKNDAAFLLHGLHQDGDDGTSPALIIPQRRHGLLRFGIARALYRGPKKFLEKLREGEKPQPRRLPEDEKAKLDRAGKGEGKLASEAEQFGADGKKLESLTADAAKARKLGSDIEAGAQGLRDAGIAAREAGTGLRTLWEGSPLIRIGGAVAAGTAVAATTIVAAPVVIAGVVGVGAFGIASIYKGSVAEGAKAAWKWGSEALVPTAARTEFAQGNYLSGVDKTLGLSDFWHATVKVGGALKAGVVAAWNDPEKAKKTVSAAVEKTEKYGEFAFTALSNNKIRNAAATAIGAAVTSEDTTASLTALGNAALADKAVMAKLTTLQASPYGTLAATNDNAIASQPVATSGGSSARRPRVAASVAMPHPELN